MWARENIGAGNFVGSIAWLRKCIQFAPNDPLYHAVLARSFHGLGPDRDERHPHLDTGPLIVPPAAFMAELTSFSFSLTFLRSFSMLACVSGESFSLISMRRSSANISLRSFVSLVRRSAFIGSALGHSSPHNVLSRPPQHAIPVRAIALRPRQQSRLNRNRRILSHEHADQPSRFAAFLERQFSIA
jgi:hypothetical protein